MKATTAILASLMLLAPAAARAQDGQAADRQFIALADGESRDLFGATYTAHGDVLAVAVLSSELVSLAVIDGELSRDGLAARAGRALVTPLDGGRTRRFLFDARRLAASLRPDWQARAQAPLARLAAAQRRQRFWGLIEPVGLNAAAPIARGAEAMRRTYLADPVVADLRHAAAGNVETLARLTAQRFAAAIAAGDADGAAALIDPAPFLASGESAGEWRAARVRFARDLAASDTTRAALDGVEVQPAADGGGAVFLAVAPGRAAYRIILVARERAWFVAALEPQS